METKSIVNKRTGVGVGLGAVVGFFLGGPVGSGVGALVGGAIANATPPSQKGQLSPARRIIYQKAITSTKDPKDLMELADLFESENLRPWAIMLRKRAALRALPPDVRQARQTVYRKALASDSPEEILTVASLFENEGAADAAKNLRDHADAVKAAHAAGKSAKPMADGKAIEKFAHRLSQAILSFGPDSDQAKSAAANFVAARGMQPTQENVMEVIAVCASELNVAPPQAEEEASSAAGPTPETQEPPADASAPEGAPADASAPEAGPGAQVPEPPPSGTVVVEASASGASAE
jgi:hypothetical protein